MNINKKMLILVSCVAAVTTGVMLYYAGDNEDIKEERQVLLRERNVEAEPEVEKEENYMVMLESGVVTLYRINGETKTAIDSIKIDESYYPMEDILALREGIAAYNIEEGFGILENFAN